MSLFNWIKSNNIFLRPVPDLSNTYKETRSAKELPEMLIHLKLWGNNAQILWGNNAQILWGNNAQILWTYHILVGILATFFTILSASLIDVIDNIDIKLFSIIAAISLSLLAAFSLGIKSNNVRAAWRQLNTAIIKFNANLIDKKEVIQAYEDGEVLIGGISYSSDQIEIPKKIKLKIHQVLIQ